MALYGGPYQNWSGELPKATFDGSTTHVGSMKRLSAGAWKGTVTGNNYRTAKIYLNNTNGKVLGIAIYPNVRWWFELDYEWRRVQYGLPTSLIDEAREILNAPQTIAETNTDDTYSLRDIVEFHPEMASASMPANFDWEDDNTLKPILGNFEFEPQPSWSFQFNDDIMVTDADNFTVGERGTARLTAIQHVLSADDVETFDPTSDNQEPDDDADPFIYIDGYSRTPDEVVQTAQVEMVPDGIFDIEMIRQYDDITTPDIDEARYKVMRRLTGYSGDKFVPDRWLQSGGFMQTQEEAEERFELTVTNTEAFVENERTVMEQEAEAARAGTQIWSETIEPNEFSDLTGEQTYTLKVGNEAGNYSLLRGSVVMEVINADSDDEAISQAEAYVQAEANPEPEVYEVESWRYYIDALEAHRLDPEAYPLPDNVPFRGIFFYGQHDYLKQYKEYSDDDAKDPTSRSLGLIDKELVAATGGQVSGGMRLYIRSGYAVRFNMTTDNAAYFYSNLKGVSGPKTAPRINSPGESSLHLSPSFQFNQDDEMQFTLKSDTKKLTDGMSDGYIEIDIDHGELEGGHEGISSIKVRSLGHDLFIDDAPAINDDVWLSIVSVEQAGRRDDPNPPTPPEPEPEPEDDETAGMGDIAFAAVAAIVGVLIITLLVRGTGGAE